MQILKLLLLQFLFLAAKRKIMLEEMEREFEGNFKILLSNEYNLTMSD